MISHNSSRLLGYLYGGLCLTCSVLFLINSSHLLSSGDNSGIGAAALVFAIISCIFDIYLIAGIVLRHQKYVKYHLEFISIIYVILLIGLFGGCIITAIAVTDAKKNEITSAIVIGSTVAFCFGVVTISIFYTLSLWIINGINSFIKYEIVHSVTMAEGEML
ncbi:uncharacterized protein LOC109415908 [Aedes albopictus]|uniref:Uncharacterized protein n=1 Tax=Aedes albopictus TaxID=7160 RepID=A0ABM1Z708_AEDAL|nr:uncharacterized protein LOC109415908 [Aedes albopictus]